MFELETLENIFTKKIFRIPDYQRGYAWGESQLEDFWNDLINLNDERDHYTGVLTVRKIDSVPSDSDLYWLINGKKYSLYHVIDGQQRLTTSIILIKTIFEELDRKETKGDDILLNFDTLEDHKKTYLYEVKPGDLITSFKFGYEKDNPSHKYFIHNILDVPDAGTIHETFYTLNLKNAQVFFRQQVKEILDEKNGREEIEKIFRSLTVRFKFNFYVIEDDFDQFVAFETMNNRGKKLSNLELLKNRLIYLSTLFTKTELPDDSRKKLRDEINEAWTEVYYQLGRNKHHPLNDDDFLRAHWIMYFIFTKKRGDDYVDYLLNKKFTAQNVLTKKAVKVNLDEAKEVRDEDFDNQDEVEENTIIKKEAQLPAKDIKEYVNSLKSASKKWFQTWYPTFDHDVNEITEWIQKINRLGMFYFRPLLMAILLDNRPSDEEKVKTLKSLERFIFLVFRLSKANRNYRQSEFSNFARYIYREEKTLADLRKALTSSMSYLFKDDKFIHEKFYETIRDRYDSSRADGFYGWPGLTYFLYEYEQSLKHQGREEKLTWEDYTDSKKNKTSIEHVYPQTPTDQYWSDRFDTRSWHNFKILHSLGNLLPLSKAINSSLQNVDFDSKKTTTKDASGKVIRSGYENGSWSEREVSRYDEWTPESIKERGLKMLSFLEDRWNISLGAKEDKLRILHLDMLDFSSNN